MIKKKIIKMRTFLRRTKGTKVRMKRITVQWEEAGNWSLCIVGNPAWMRRSSSRIMNTSLHEPVRSYTDVFSRYNDASREETFSNRLFVSGESQHAYSCLSQCSPDELKLFMPARNRRGSATENNLETLRPTTPLAKQA